MSANRVQLIVEVDLDPVPGWGNVSEDYRRHLQYLLDESIPHYNPTVTIADEDEDEDEPETCPNGDEDCPGEYLCRECWNDGKDNAAIDAEDARQGR